MKGFQWRALQTLSPIYDHWNKWGVIIGCRRSGLSRWHNTNILLPSQGVKERSLLASEYAVASPAPYCILKTSSVTPCRVSKIGVIYMQRLKVTGDKDSGTKHVPTCHNSWGHASIRTATRGHMFGVDLQKQTWHIWHRCFRLRHQETPCRRWWRSRKHP